jgi:LysR family transcriptional regulator, glycine cleavage system transcriptional activator
MPDLPPLNALRAFEVAARCGSFVLAGRELGVTAAAVSAQIRALEDHLGKRLFLRQGNRITLTDAGRALYPRLESALTEIADVALQVRAARGRSGLVISCLPSLAEHWLVPALADYPAREGLEIRVEDDPVPLAQDGADLRLAYGAALYPDYRSETLFADAFVPVCAPGLARPGGIGALPDSAFIHTDWGPAYATQPSWPAWLALARIGRLADPAGGLRTGSTGLALMAARAGLGVALVPSRLAAQDVASGHLAIPDATRLPMSSPYVMVWAQSREGRRALQSLRAWLRARAVGPVIRPS